MDVIAPWMGESQGALLLSSFLRPSFLLVGSCCFSGGFDGHGWLAGRLVHSASHTTPASRHKQDRVRRKQVSSAAGKPICTGGLVSQIGS